jgi:lipoate-protein ligase B
MKKTTYRKECNRKWLCVDIPSIDYQEAWKLQLDLVEARHSGENTSDIVLLLEHPPVFTLGRRGGRDHLMVSEGFLNQHRVPLVHVERGGDITYHGPGQIVGYFIVDLKAMDFQVVGFVSDLEEVMIRIAGDWGIPAERNPLNRGAWVGASKIGSVGIAVRRGISFHGFALNVNTSLEPFGWINPCGLEGIQITSMKQVLGREIPMEEIRRATVRNIQKIFNVALEKLSLKDLYRRRHAKTRAVNRGVE